MASLQDRHTDAGPHGEASSGSALPLPPLEVPDKFPFPYPQPYDIQIELMKTVFRAIEERKIAIVESPTGTGKSLTLLTSTLTWLRANARRLEQHSREELEKRLAEENKDDPPWVLQHALQAHLKDLSRARDERIERLRRARQREDELRRQSSSYTWSSTASHTRSAKRRRVDTEISQPEEDDSSKFLPEDVDPENGLGAADMQSLDGMNVTKEVKAMMEHMKRTAEPKTDEDEEQACPKIFFTSRTHSQLRQLVGELRKTEFATEKSTEGQSTRPSAGPKVEIAFEEAPVRMVALGGRKQLCINEKVRAIGRSKGDDKMNEACLDMQKADSKSGRCPYLPTKEKAYKLLDVRDSIHAQPRDIEDLVELGKRENCCPYYAARKSIKQAESSARTSLEIDVRDQIVVIDEAHSRSEGMDLMGGLVLSYCFSQTTDLIDTLLHIYSVQIRLETIQTAHEQLQTYYRKFRNRLKPEHAVRVAQAMSVISSLVQICEEERPSFPTKPKTTVVDVNQLVRRLSGGQDQVNLVALVKYLHQSKLAQKLKRQGTIRYMLLNPAQRFEQLVSEARCIVLAGGTMEPISDFLVQLFPQIDRSRFSTLSCRHIIPRENMLAQVVRRGPARQTMEFTYANRFNDELLRDLGAMIASLLNLVPDGIVVFLPSYSFLEKLKNDWDATGIMTRIRTKKDIFFEPEDAGGVESTLQAFGDAIRNKHERDQPKRTGAVLFAVVGAKLSEGINFSDELGRCIIMVGLPFPNSQSVDLKERMAYVSSLSGSHPNAGKELYENLCMRAVNQSIGRAIRHRNDYAAILLVDHRYDSPRIAQKLPRWIGQDLQAGDFPEAVRNLAGFFRTKR